MSPFAPIMTLNRSALFSNSDMLPDLPSLASQGSMICVPLISLETDVVGPLKAIASVS